MFFLQKQTCRRVGQILGRFSTWVVFVLYTVYGGVYCQQTYEQLVRVLCTRKFDLLTIAGYIEIHRTSVMLSYYMCLQETVDIEVWKDKNIKARVQ